MNELRGEKLQKLAGKLKNGKFLRIKVNCSMLPPCRNTLNKKIERSVLVSRIWAQADTPNPHERMIPENFGWHKSGDEYRPVWYDGSALPDSLQNVGSMEDEVEQ